MERQAELTKQQRARGLRYKKAMLAQLNFEDISNSLYDIAEVCAEYQYYFEGDADDLINALDGDEEEAYEFKMLFSELSAECDQLRDMLNDMQVNEHFDDFFVGIMLNGECVFNAVGYDDYEEDYYHLTSFETELASNESAKRLKRLTKDELLSVCGQCFGIAVAYFNVQYKYDYLKAAFDVLKDNNVSYLQIIKDIEEAYEKADSKEWLSYSEEVRRFDRLIRNFDEYSKIWIE